MTSRRGLRTGPSVSRLKSGFTLVELTVVIAIISVLMAILLPMLKEVAENARRTQCVSQERQMGVALQIYAGDHSGFLPIRHWYWYDPNNHRAELGLIAEKYIDDDSVFRCPSRGSRNSWNGAILNYWMPSTSVQISYGGWLYDTWYYLVRLDRLTNDVCLAMDQTYTQIPPDILSLNYSSYGWGRAPNHLGGSHSGQHPGDKPYTNLVPSGANSLSPDLHVRWVPQTAMGGLDIWQGGDVRPPDDAYFEIGVHLLWGYANCELGTGAPNVYWWNTYWGWGGVNDGSTPRRGRLVQYLYKF